MASWSRGQLEVEQPERVDAVLYCYYCTMFYVGMFS